MYNEEKCDENCTLYCDPKHCRLDLYIKRVSKKCTDMRETQKSLAQSFNSTGYRADHRTLNILAEKNYMKESIVDIIM